MLQRRYWAATGFAGKDFPKAGIAQVAHQLKTEKKSEGLLMIELKQLGERGAQSQCVLGQQMEEIVLALHFEILVPSQWSGSLASRCRARVFNRSSQFTSSRAMIVRHPCLCGGKHVAT
ncbi:hypothetical protein D6B98_38520 [Bradyrhizobium sp. LVM 105]|nr:hypothetical protein D6B98_38520 [Bradyrhizobium sp. LVM 105]